MQYALPMTGRRTTLPPLGLITVAALLPQHWQIRLIDTNIEPLTDRDIEWADVLLSGGMRVQSESLHDLIARAHDLDKPVVVGGPAPTTAPDEYDDADVLFLGEAEEHVNRLVEAILNPQPGTIVDGRGARPKIHEQSCVPRYDLLDLAAYSTMSFQYSRGCPFRCEFCDIIEIFGRQPRVKSPRQVLTELDALYRLGHRGTLFFVDDNFIGNKPAVKAMLPALVRWQTERGHPFSLYTQASLNLADDPELMRAMVKAGFSSVFLGIETPSTQALLGAGKTQNLRLGPTDAVNAITGSGLEVMGGFIVGFDEDDETALKAQRAFIRSSPIPLAMVGLLTALPGTALSRRLAAEGRLRAASTGDQFFRPNFEPAMDELALLRGYADLLADIYSPDAYYDRCEESLYRVKRAPRSRGITLHNLHVLATTFWKIGVQSPRRRRYWRLLGRALLHARHNFAPAVAHAVQGEHMIRYTQEVVLPRVANAVAEFEQQHALRRVRRAA